MKLPDLRHACQQASLAQRESSNERQHQVSYHDSRCGSILEQRPLIANDSLRRGFLNTFDHEHMGSSRTKRPRTLLADSDVDGSYQMRFCIDRMDKELCDQLLAFGAHIEHLRHQIIDLQMEIQDLRDQSECQEINQG